MESFIYRNPVKLIFGVGEVAKVGREAALIGKKALLVTGRSYVVRSGLLDRIAGYLKESGVDYIHFGEVEPNPRSTTIDKGGALARKEGCDFVLGLGGGSVMDASKAIAAVAVSGYPIWDYVYDVDLSKLRKIKSALPIMLIPTLAATSSEGNRGGVISNWETHQKAPLFSDHLFPKVSIVDPELTVSTDRETTVNGAMDIISHVVESYFTGPENTPLQDRFTESIIRTVMENLEIALENPADLVARANLSWCSTMALSGPLNLGRPGPFPLHAMEHVLSGHYDIAHGRGLAIMFPALMRHTYRDRPEKFSALAKNIFFIEVEKMKLEAAALEFIERFEAWMKSVGMYTRLSEVGIDAERLEIMAEDVIKIYGMGKDYTGGIRPLYKADIMAMFEMVL